jgi:hypothetical protein
MLGFTRDQCRKERPSSRNFLDAGLPGQIRPRSGSRRQSVLPMCGSARRIDQLCRNSQSAPGLCLSEIKSGHMMQSAEDRAAKNTPCEQREVTEAGQQAEGQVVLHIVRHVGTHDLDRDVSRAPSSWAPSIGPIISSAMVAALCTGDVFSKAATSAPGSDWCPSRSRRETARFSAKSRGAAIATCAFCLCRRHGLCWSG